MNTNTGIIIGIIVLVAVGGGIFASMNSNDDAMMAEEKLEQQVMEDTKMAQDTVMRENKVMEEKDAMMKADSMMKNDETSMVDKGDTMMKAGSYEAYAPEKLARAETGDVVLFFHASWCPSCRALNSSIESNLTSIPEGVTILKTDYDKETELKKKYGVTYQHTLVQVDTSGNMIKKWSGGGTLDTILSQIQ